VLLINFGSDSRSKVCQEKRNTFLGQFSPYFFNSCDKTLTISQLPQQLSNGYWHSQLPQTVALTPNISDDGAR
jgi:hypothetical protein